MPPRSRPAVPLALVIVVGHGCGGATDAGSPRDRGAVRVELAWPGASPEALEAAVTEPVEAALARVAGVAAIRSRATVPGKDAVIRDARDPIR